MTAKNHEHRDDNDFASMTTEERNENGLDGEY
jgi:hypothetical protein